MLKAEKQNPKRKKRKLNRNKFYKQVGKSYTTKSRPIKANCISKIQTRSKRREKTNNRMRKKTDERKN